MGRDKAKDDKFFNCSQQHEHDYVASLYPENEDRVKEFLKKCCDDETFSYSTHDAVYNEIEKKLGLKKPA